MKERMDHTREREERERERTQKSRDDGGQDQAFNNSQWNSRARGTSGEEPPRRDTPLSAIFLGVPPRAYLMIKSQLNQLMGAFCNRGEN